MNSKNPRYTDLVKLWRAGIGRDDLKDKDTEVLKPPLAYKYHTPGKVDIKGSEIS